MTDRYFEHFPIIKYGNTNVVDITKRVAILESVSKNPFIFYPYEITDGERADQFSTRYYEDPYKGWILYLTNKIVDPYYEWYMSPREFDEFLVNKYGSLETAYNKVYHYRNNWENADDISVSAFNALTEILKLYWQPVYGASSNIISYGRRQKNWVVNTNKIVSYVVSNSSFTNNEICDVVFDGNNVGTAQVLNISNTTVYMQHTAGVTLSNDTVTITGSSYIYGRESQINTAFTNSSLTVENLVDEEEVYWKAITCYEYENEKNEFNKTIRILDNRFTMNIVQDFQDLIGE
jgi:hypothetical protein